VSDERIARLEEAVSVLREEKASLVTSMEHLTRAVDKLTVTVDGLSATMNQGRGALWTVICASSAVGAILAIVATLISNAFGKAS
jgi:hypothetical protein